jgi:UPF0755 protein
MSPVWGPRGKGSQDPPPPAHPAAGGDWARDLDWEDPRAQPSASRRPGPLASLVRWSHSKHAPPANGAPPRRRASGRVLVRRLMALVIVAVVVFAAWFLISLYQPFQGSAGAPLTVRIPAGASGSTVGTLLADDGVISSSFFFDIRASLDGDSGKFQAGVYALRRGMSYSAALAALTRQSGSTAEIAITIPEGLTRDQIAALVKRDGLRGNYLKASTPKAAGFSPQSWGAHPGVDSLEGFLFPDTYYVFRHSWVSSLVQKQLAAFKQNFAQVNMTYAKSRNLTDYDVLTIASILEREAQLKPDDYKVSSVIYNRLALGTPLGLDTVLLYYLHNPKGGLTESDLHLTTPYNTRLHTGLPPTPISNPGVLDLDAAAHPAHTGYLYFVVKPNACGALAYATTQTEFNVEVAAYNTAVSADHGRIPDGCSK